MAITRPVTKTLISTAAWGIPITDQVNANAADIVAAKPTLWTPVTFMNGFSNYGSGFQTVQYRKIGDIVYVRGLMAGGALSTICFQLPVGFRPPAHMQFPSSSSGAIATLQINNDGATFPQAGFVNGFFIVCNFSTTP